MGVSDGFQALGFVEVDCFSVGSLGCSGLGLRGVAFFLGDASRGWRQRPRDQQLKQLYTHFLGFRV